VWYTSTCPRLNVALETKGTRKLDAIINSFFVLPIGILDVKNFVSLEDLFSVFKKEAVALGAMVVLDALLHFEVPLVHLGS